MKKNVLSRASDAEIITFFYKIFGNRIRMGMDQKEAREEGYGAVALRYGVAKGRLRNIISNRRSSLGEGDASFRQNALTLMDDLRVVNNGLEETIARNERLISLLKECINED